MTQETRSDGGGTDESPSASHSDGGSRIDHETSILDAPWRWLFLTGNRLVIAGGLLVVIFLLFVATDVFVGTVAQEERSPLLYLFSALTGGNFTLITIILSITQLVISRQLSNPGELRNQIDSTNSYRESVEETTSLDVAPVTPTEFQQTLHQSTLTILRTLREESEENRSEGREELLERVSILENHIGGVEAVLSRSDHKLFDGLAATLSANYSDDIYWFRKLRATYSDEFTDTMCDCIDTVVVRLQEIDVARQYTKALYIQDELSRLSRHLLYVGLPAVLTAIFILRIFSAGRATFSALQIATFVPIAATVSISPLALLFAYVLRLSVVAQRTLAVTPFTLPMRDREIDI